MFKRVASTLFLLLSYSMLLHAQSDENRNKLEMTVTYGGKSFVSELLSVGTNISRHMDDSYNLPAKDSAGKPNQLAEKRNSFFLSMVVRKIKPDLLSLFAKRANMFTGTITITDTYGKNPPTTIRFTSAALESYSDQFSGSSYADNYSGASISINCKTLNINGIEIEP